MEETADRLTVPGSFMQRSATAVLAVLILVAPIKFASSVSSHVFSNFPTGIAQFIITPWPVIWVPFVSGLALILVLIANGVPKAVFFQKTWFLWLAPAVAFMVCWIGWIETDNLLQPISFTSHMAGVCAFTFALLIHMAYCPRSRQIFLWVFGVGTFLLCFVAAYEYFWSLRFTLAEIEKQIAVYGEESMDPQIISRLRQNRPQAGFPIPNSLGGHLVLVAPFIIALMHQAGKKIDPPNVSKILLPILTGGIMVFFIYTTKSRAATLSLFVSLLVAGSLIPLTQKTHFKKHRGVYIPAMLSLPVIAIAVYFVIQDGRSFSSLDARFTYWDSGLTMFLENPLTGVGLGEFFYWFVRMKPEGAETARLPHSMFIFFASGCGIAGVAAVVTYVLTPIAVIISQVRGKVKTISPLLFFGSLIGLLAWILHTQIDFNIHIPASLMAFSSCLLFAIDLNGFTKSEGSRTIPKFAMAILIICALLSCLRWPGDYYLAKLDQKITMRHTMLKAKRRPPPIETLLPLAEKGSKWSPGLFLFWERIGGEAMRERRYDLAANAYTQVVKINPHYAAGHFRLSRALAGMQRLEDARNAFNAGLVWNPNPTRYSELRTYLFPSDVSAPNEEIE